MQVSVTTTPPRILPWNVAHYTVPVAATMDTERGEAKELGKILPAGSSTLSPGLSVCVDI